MRSWKKAKSGEVYDPAPKRSHPLNLAARRVNTVPDAPDGSGRWAFRGDEELVPQPPLVRISIDAAPREKRKQKCLWVSDSSRSILSRCWVLAREGRECAKHLGPQAPPPLALPTCMEGEHNLSGAGTTGQRCTRVRPLLAAARRLPLVPRARHPPPGLAPPTTPQLVERPLQLES